MIFSFFFFLSHASSILPINKSCLDTDRQFTCGEMLICNNINYSCQFCDNDSQCSSYEKDFYCRFSNQFNGNICVYEPILHQFTTYKIIGACLICLFGIVISLSGIDGGCLYIPVFISIIRIPMNYVSPISSSVIFGGTFSIFLHDVCKHHSFYQRPLINYNVAAIFEPLSWIGVIFGVILNSILPNWMFYSLNLLVLLIVSIVFLVKSIQKFNRRNDYNENELLSFPSSYLGPAFSRIIILIFIHSWIIYMIFPFLSGGNRFQSIATFPMCSIPYWIVTFLPILLYLILEIVFLRSLREYPVLGHNAKTGFWNFTLILLSSLVSGCISGLLGYSGEIIKGPLLGKLGLELDETKATSNLMMFFTSLVVCIHYIANGMLDYKDFLILAGAGFISFFIGSIINKFYKKKIQNSGILNLILAILCIAGFGGVLYFSSQNIKETVENKTYFRFHDFCMLSE
ncbi:hypothetical protein TRFO_33410 [Tritrichomonas foetus]|uniref:Sulfite exporter TauE/SafE family protein n=1 Tax=Tritrichomonas foetus TaxID=1144522 RepID=A0A1J4JMV7_9EUKA|nr:hypothetical protein TRFO_33410 [Tritrichomonas foetus]|eukprot:OHT00026.1 hypothetical protein TRFO_33410 [Tritrichomonas foetus]